MNKNNSKLYFLLSITLFLPISLFAQSQDITSIFPYKINFSQQEINLLKTLNVSTLKKLIELAKIAQTRSLSGGINQSNAISTASTSMTASNYGLASGYNSNLNQIQSGNFSNPFLPRDNTPLSSLLSGASGSAQPDSVPASYIQSGGQQPYTPPSNVSYDNTFVESDGGNCANFGVKITGGSCGYGPNDMHPKLKLDFRNLCRITKKTMNITNSRRETACMGKPQAYHSGGRAFDSEFTPFSEAEKTIIVLYFMAHYYNGIGGYGAAGKGSGAPHFDIRSYTMRWGPSTGLSSCTRGSYPSYVVRAFDEVGVQPCDVSISPQAMHDKAVAALNRLGKSEFAK